MKQRCTVEFLHANPIAPIDISWMLRRVNSGFITKRQWLVSFSSGDDSVRGKPCSRWPGTSVTPWHEGCLHILAHPCTATNYYQDAAYRAAQFQCNENDSDSEISQSFVWVAPINAPKATEWTSNPSLSGPVEWGWSWWFPALHCHQWWDAVLPPQTGVKMTAVHGLEAFIPHQRRKFKMLPSAGKVMFCNKKGWSFWSSWIINSNHYIAMLTKVKAREEDHLSLATW